MTCIAVDTFSLNNQSFILCGVGHGPTKKKGSRGREEREKKRGKRKRKVQPMPAHHKKPHPQKKPFFQTPPPPLLQRLVEHNRGKHPCRGRCQRSDDYLHCCIHCCNTCASETAKKLSFPRLSKPAMDQRSKFGCREISHTYLLCSEAWIRTFMSAP